MSYVHDAWNRLVEVKQTVSSTTTTLGKYQYNGLHWRTVKLSDVRPVLAAPETLSERRIMYYDASWRLIQEDIDDHANDHTSSFILDRRAQQFWGVRYIDDAVLRREDRGALAIEEDPGDPEAEPPIPSTEYVPAHGPDGTYSLIFHDITDAQFSVVALVGVQPAFTSLSAPLIERVDYDSYGNARHHASVDFDGDGAYTSTDLSASFLIAWMAGSMAADYNRSSGVQVQDLYDYLNAWFASPGDVPSGWISNPSTGPGSTTPDNPIGYCGYVFNKETGDYTVRFRHYSPLFGRWLERDPAGYIEGLSLFQYRESEPIRNSDPLGLGPFGDWWDWTKQLWGPRQAPKRPKPPPIAEEFHAACDIQKRCGFSPDPNNPWEQPIQDLHDAHIGVVETGAEQVGEATDGFYGRGLIADMAMAGVFQCAALRVAASEMKEISRCAKKPITLDKWGPGADGMVRAAMNRIKPQDGVIQVVMHSNGEVFAVTLSGQKMKLNHRALASWMKSSGVRGASITLYSCSAGQNRLAQDLANKTGLRVTAPTDKLHIFPDGRMVIGPNENTHTGSWKTFEPGCKCPK